MSDLPDELLSYIAGYHPPSHPIHFVVKSTSSGDSIHNGSDDNGNHHCCDREKKESDSSSGEGGLKQLVSSGDAHFDEYKQFSEEVDGANTKELDSPCNDNHAAIEKEESNNPAIDECDETDFDIALEVLRGLTPENSCIKVFEEGALDVDIDPIPVNVVAATSASGIAIEMNQKQCTKNRPVSQQSEATLPKSQNEILRRNSQTQSQVKATPKVSFAEEPAPKAKRIIPHKGKKSILSIKSKKSSSRPTPSPRGKGKKSIHHSDRRMAGRSITLREAFDHGELDPTKTILCAKGNQNRTHGLNQDRLRFIRARLPSYIALREQNASNMEIANFNKHAFHEFVGEDPKRTFLGLDEHGEWRRLAPKEARGKLAQCFRDEWREWNKRGQPLQSQPSQQQKQQLSDRGEMEMNNDRGDR